MLNILCVGPDFVFEGGIGEGCWHGSVFEVLEVRGLFGFEAGDPAVRLGCGAAQPLANSGTRRFMVVSFSMEDGVQHDKRDQHHGGHNAVTWP